MKKIKQNVIGIYGIEDIKTGNIYIGQSKDIAKRWSNHSAFLKNNKHRYKKLQEAYNLDCKRIKYTILEECSTEMLSEREDWWIKNIERIDGWNLLNKQKHGGNHGTKVKDTSKMKKAQTGENNGNCCKLSVKDVKEIKALLVKGISKKEIAKIFKISETHVRNIQHKKRWRSVI